MIKSISLQNWKTHLDTTLEFSKGTNVIVGKMGSGKSSIMDAISFALYGTFPSQASRRVSLEETIMERPLKQERATVKLEFDYNGKEYSIERIVKRNSINEAYLREGGRLISGPKSTDVNRKMEEVLEVNYDLFSRAVYSEQNQIDYFLRLSPAQRKEKFDELLGLNRYEIVRANAGTLLGRLKKITEDRSAFLADQKNKFDANRLGEYEKRIAAKAKEISEKKQAVDSVGKEITQSEAAGKKLEEEGRTHKALNDLYIKTKARYDALNEQLASASQKLKGKDPKMLADSLAAGQGRLTQIENDRKALKKTLEEEEKKITILREQAAVLRSALELNAKTAKNAGALEGSCPVCKRALAAHDKQRLEKELSHEAKKITVEKDELDNTIKKASESTALLRRNIEDSEKAKDTLVREIESAKRSLELHIELAEKAKQKAGADAEVKAAASQLEKSKFDEKALEAQREVLSGLRESKAKLGAQARADAEMLQELETGHKRLKEARDSISELEAQVGANKVSLEKLSVFTSALRATQSELRHTMIETINEAMDEVWGKVYPYEDLTSVKIAVQEGSYEVMVRQRSGQWCRVEGILSGGERSSAAITMRIAVSLVLTQNLGWIILDEPTHNLDANAVRELSEMMRTHLPQLIDQIFIITHDKEMENAASGKLYMLEREKENDGATRIVGDNSN